MSDDVGQMLVQGAAAQHIEQLQTAADTEERDPRAKRRIEQRQLGGVPPRVDGRGLLVPRRRVGGRVHIRARQQQQTVETANGRLHTGQRRQQYGYTARGGHPVDELLGVKVASMSKIATLIDVVAALMPITGRRAPSGAPVPSYANEFTINASQCSGN